MNGFYKRKKTIERMQAGPLGHHVVQYAERLRADGYARHSGRLMLLNVASFNRWLSARRIAPAQVRPVHAERYLRFWSQENVQRRKSGRVGLTRWLRLLREQGVIPDPASFASTPGERVVADYDAYLKTERSLSLRTRDTYGPLARQFLSDRYRRGPVDLSKLCASDVIQHVRHYAKRLGSKRMQLIGSALRSFLQFARWCGCLTTDLATQVPSVASWPLSALPKSLPAKQVERVLARCLRTTAVGRRDHAILLLLARLGLRACEVVGLTLEDIEWETSRITIRGKLNRSDQLPLPADVGTAIAAYLQRGRPKSRSSRRLFLLARAPWTGFKDSSSVDRIVKQALGRAGIESPRNGAHQFRHTLACELLRRGRRLTEIGEILRHRRPDTTAIYAKVDLLALRPLALAWPGGAR